MLLVECRSLLTECGALLIEYRALFMECWVLLIDCWPFGSHSYVWHDSFLCVTWPIDMLLWCKARLLGRVTIEAANRIGSLLGRLHGSQIQKVLLTALPVTHLYHQLPALLCEFWQLCVNLQNQFWQRRIAQLLYFGISQFCTQSRGLELNLEA